MTTTIEHAGFNKVTSLYPEEQELMAPDALELTPQTANQLRAKASHWLTRAQKDLHDAIFARDGSDESLDLYASARAELDSAEAWALRVAKALSRQRD
ncbi:FruA-associating protein, FapA [Pyxidicoccus xibeiensis]|uniref:FruA-associating protein, FapA n=1 Tax=Pyxidicoccus xibeiensis TaxID=2906759 RepID=UPI0020A756A7|nr:FruA-associating protein, FapA [Pyxidicoccus xibeiensis]MCP3142930.1 FruA-associating protein, FapA [Pyxidicoccus xibeiensis]